MGEYKNNLLSGCVRNNLHSIKEIGSFLKGALCKLK